MRGDDAHGVRAVRFGSPYAMIRPAWTSRPDRPAGAPYDCTRVLHWSRDGTLLAMLDDDGGVAVVEFEPWRFVHRVGHGAHACFVPGTGKLAVAEVQRLVLDPTIIAGANPTDSPVRPSRVIAPGPNMS